MDGHRCSSGSQRGYYRNKLSCVSLIIRMSASLLVHLFIYLYIYMKTCMYAGNVPPQALLALEMEGVLCTAGMKAGWRSNRSLFRLGTLRREKQRGKPQKRRAEKEKEKEGERNEDESRGRRGRKKGNRNRVSQRENREIRKDRWRRSINI